MRRWILLTTSAVLAACAAPERDTVGTGLSAGDPGAGTDSGAGPGTTGVTASTTDDTSGGGTTTAGPATTSDGDDDSGGVSFDVGSPETTGGAGCIEGDDCGCTSVDVLFVWDNSGSMGGHQASLASAFPQFVDAMFDVLPTGTDLHVGLTLSHFCPDENNGGHNETALCKAAESDAYILEAFKDPHDEDLGLNGLQGRLFEYQGQRYGSANTGDVNTKQGLKDWFAGLPGAIGYLGCNPEFPVASAGYAFDPVNEPYNGGFLRDEGSVLLIFFLTDEGGHSDLTPVGVQGYVDMVTSAKAGCGGSSCVITGGLLNTKCVDANATMWEFLSAFGPPAWGDVGEPQFWPPGPNDQQVDEYTQFMSQALAQVVGTTCEQIPPVG